MIAPQEFTAELKQVGFDFFTGVPDSLLKELCACISDQVPVGNHIIGAHEGGAVALAAGYHLATAKAGLVYLQNSGTGHAVNPLLSLADPDVYAVPMLLIIGWRGEPGVKDEPQHVKQGRVQEALLQALEYPYEVLARDITTAREQLIWLTKTMYENNTPVILLVRKDTFAPYEADKKPAAGSMTTGSDISSSGVVKAPSYTMQREPVLKIILNHLNDNDRIVSTTGKTSREIYEIREARDQEHGFDFLTVGSMGHSSMIALGLAKYLPSSAAGGPNTGQEQTIESGKGSAAEDQAGSAAEDQAGAQAGAQAGSAAKDQAEDQAGDAEQIERRRIVCIDGDGAAIMHMGNMALFGRYAPKNLYHIIINNGSHDSVGGQPTIGFDLHFYELAKQMNYAAAYCAETEEQLQTELKHLLAGPGPALLEVRTRKGARKDLGRPKTTPGENKTALMKNLGD